MCKNLSANKLIGVQEINQLIKANITLNECKDLININIMTKKERNWLNSYHKKVFDNLKNAMNEIEMVELQKACSAI